MTTAYATSGGFDNGASQFAGNGFMPSQGQVPGSAQKRQFESRKQTLRALTIKQVSDLERAVAHDPDAAPLLDGAEVANVTLVGKIVSADDKHLNVAYGLDDGTGCTQALYWKPEIETEADAAARAEWRVGAYVRIHGAFQASAGAGRVLTAYSIRPITDFNEVSYHMAQVIFQHLANTKAASGPTGGAASGGAGNPGAGLFGGGATPAGVPGGAAGAASSLPYANPGGALTHAQATVLGIFNASGDSDVGLTAREVLSRAGGQLSVADVTAAVEFLQNEGHLYSTVDDMHFKPCNPA